MKRTTSSLPTVMSVATEWFSSKGGLSTFNRRLCVALAAAGAPVICMVPAASREEDEHARVRNVRLVRSKPSPGDSKDDSLRVWPNSRTVRSPM
jgi:hypothetical protein